MRDQQDRRLAQVLAKRAPNQGVRLDIDIRGGLVHQNDFRAGQKCAGENELPLTCADVTPAFLQWSLQSLGKPDDEFREPDTF